MSFSDTVNFCTDELMVANADRARLSCVITGSNRSGGRDLLRVRDGAKREVSNHFLVCTLILLSELKCTIKDKNLPICCWLHIRGQHHRQFRLQWIGHCCVAIWMSPRARVSLYVPQVPSCVGIEISLQITTSRSSGSVLVLHHMQIYVVIYPPCNQ